MLKIGGDDTARPGSMKRVLITISCDGESLFCHPPVVVPGEEVKANEWPTEVASKLARKRGWKLVDSNGLGRSWLCPSCLRR